MPLGTVRILVIDRGYGFVARADGDDVFFHHSAVPGHGFKKLTVGQAVEFELAGGDSRSPKGPRARSVTVPTATDAAGTH
ncbi:MAG: cold shock domain-containing protein [Planctomycetales bacterium]|nr:cold shock domain-containing protein [Planctomycetales bacterium]MBN8625381.1 cold shock domain-containing protein [Planctomycetota bacterium]